MRKMWIVGLAAVSVSLMGMAAENTEPFKVGEKWEYKHEGPRPMGFSTDPVDGDWVRSVESVKEDGDKKIWTVKEQYGQDDQRASSLQVNQNKEATAIKFGENTITYTPPRPLNFPELKAGEEKIVETKLEGEWGAIPINTTYKREADETVTVPAGEYKDCEHYQVTNIIVFNRDGEEIKAKSVENLWYHPTVNGLVKRVFVNDPEGQSDRGFTATSELKAYTAPEK